MALIHTVRGVGYMIKAAAVTSPREPRPIAPTSPFRTRDPRGPLIPAGPADGGGDRIRRRSSLVVIAIATSVRARQPCSTGRLQDELAGTAKSVRRSPMQRLAVRRPRHPLSPRTSWSAQTGLQTGTLVMLVSPYGSVTGTVVTRRSRRAGPHAPADASGRDALSEAATAPRRSAGLGDYQFCISPCQGPVRQQFEVHHRTAPRHHRGPDHRRSSRSSRSPRSAGLSCSRCRRPSRSASHCARCARSPRRRTASRTSRWIAATCRSPNACRPPEADPRTETGLRRRRAEHAAGPRRRLPRGAPAQRGADAAVRRRRQPRAAHPAVIDPRLLRAVPARAVPLGRPGGRRDGLGAHGPGAHPGAVAADDQPGRGSAAARPPRRGPRAHPVHGGPVPARDRGGRGRAAHRAGSRVVDRGARGAGRAHRRHGPAAAGDHQSARERPHAHAGGHAHRDRDRRGRFRGRAARARRRTRDRPRGARRAVLALRPRRPLAQPRDRRIRARPVDHEGDRRGPWGHDRRAEPPRLDRVHRAAAAHARRAAGAPHAERHRAGRGARRPPDRPHPAATESLSLSRGR